ncbi:MAG: hypothetical protein ACK5ZU_00020 [Acidobacteriota bacterium]
MEYPVTEGVNRGSSSEYAQRIKTPLLSPTCTIHLRSIGNTNGISLLPLPFSPTNGSLKLSPPLNRFTVSKPLKAYVPAGDPCASAGGVLPSIGELIGTWQKLLTATRNQVNLKNVVGRVKFIALSLVGIDHNLHLNGWLCAKAKGMRPWPKIKLFLNLFSAILVVFKVLPLYSRAIDNLKRCRFAVQKIAQHQTEGPWLADNPLRLKPPLRQRHHLNFEVGNRPGAGRNTRLSPSHTRHHG